MVPDIRPGMLVTVKGDETTIYRIYETHPDAKKATLGQVGLDQHLSLLDPDKIQRPYDQIKPIRKYYLESRLRHALNLGKIFADALIHAPNL